MIVDKIDIKKVFTFKQIDLLRIDLLNMCRDEDIDKFKLYLNKYELTNIIVNNLLVRIIIDGKLEFLKVLFYHIFSFLWRILK